MHLLHRPTTLRWAVYSLTILWFDVGMSKRTFENRFETREPRRTCVYQATLLTAGINFFLYLSWLFISSSLHEWQSHNWWMESMDSFEDVALRSSHLSNGLLFCIDPSLCLAWNWIFKSRGVWVLSESNRWSLKYGLGVTSCPRSFRTKINTGLFLGLRIYTWSLTFRYGSQWRTAVGTTGSWPFCHVTLTRRHCLLLMLWSPN